MLFYNKLIDLSICHGVNFKNKNIADVGCGPGALLNELKKIYPNTQLTGFDFSESVILYARKNMHGISFKIKNFIEEEIKKNYDIIFCTEVLEHLLNPAIVLKKLLNLLPENGVLILTTPDGRKDNFIGHIHFWSPESWSLFLKEQCPNLKIKTLLMENGKVNLAFIFKK
ncbi:class I SAM-dependent methyltransferase [Patescibacteria group bacterium]